MQTREITYADDESVVVFSFKTALEEDLIAAHTQNFPKRKVNPAFDPENPMAKDENGERIQPWVENPRTREALAEWAKGEIMREAMSKTHRYRNNKRANQANENADDSDLTAKVLV